MSNKDNYHEIKAILVGKSGVGKSNLINTCVGDKFDPSSTPTIANSLRQKKFEINNKVYVINLWDTMGQETYLSINKIFFKGAEIVIFVYDITKKDSFDALDFWIRNVVEILGTDFACGIVGNKNDLFLEAEVTEEEVKKYADSKGIKFKLVSAKTDPERFSEFLEILIKEPMNKNKLKKSKNDNKDNKDNKNNKDNKEKELNNDNENFTTRKKENSIKLDAKQTKKSKTCCGN